MNYFKILLFLEKGNRSMFDLSIEEQEHYLERLGEAKNDIDRGFKQYLCQNYFTRPKWKIVAFNMAAAIIMPFLTFYYLIKGLCVKQGDKIDAMIEKKGMDEVVPEEVIEKYHPDNTQWDKGASMSFSDILFLLKLVCRAPHYPYFVLKAWMNVVLYSDMIRRHRAKVMIQFGEFSFSSSILTAYCHFKGVKHVDVMHGEKLYYIRDAYFHYDEAYVWNQHYVDLFKMLRAEPTQFRIALPPSMRIDTVKYSNPLAYADYKYYLANFSEEEIISIVNSMSFARNEGKSVKYRPHPRYSDMTLLRKYVPEENIENPRMVPIQESIANMGCAVGSYTTVLVQAYFSGKDVLLDNVTFIRQYDKLKELKYILSSVNCNCLSSVQ